MSEKFTARLTNRWFGAPCEDVETLLPSVSIEPFTLDNAREAVISMGFSLDENHPYEDDISDIVESVEMCTIRVKPTEHGAEDAWIDFWRV